MRTSRKSKRAENECSIFHHKNLPDLQLHFKMNWKSINLHNNVINLIFVSSYLRHTKTRMFLFTMQLVYTNTLLPALGAVCLHIMKYTETQERDKGKLLKKL